MSASSSQRPITGVSMEEGKELICPACNAPVTRTAPVGPPMADHRVAHPTMLDQDASGGEQPLFRTTAPTPTFEEVATSMLFTGSVLIFALAILCVLAFEWLVDLALR